MDTDKEEKQRKERRRDDDERRREKSKRSRSRSPKERRDRDDDRHRRKRQRSQSRENRSKRDRREPKDDKPVDPPRKAKDTDMINTRTGGAYIPPAKLRMMQAQITDKTTAAYQRLAWEALKKSIHGHINKINVGNCGIIIKQLLKENIVRGRGLLCRSIIQAQAASLTFTNVYAALAAAINSRFPNIGELLLKRLVIQFKRGFKRNDKALCISSSTFIAHLVNQRVAHEILALELLTLLVETPTDDSVEVAIAFLKECGQKLTEVSSRGVHAIFDMLRNILHEGQLDKRVQYMIEVMFQIWKDGFKDHPAMIEELELVPEEDQFTHLLTLDDADDPQDLLNVFKLDEKFEENEQKYKTLCKEILGSDVESDEDNEGDDESGSDESGEEGAEDETEKSVTIIDNTETNLVALRRTIYLTINSSLDFEECAHKLLKMELKPGQEKELCNMFLDCCAEQRTYEKFYGLLAQRFCQINKIYIEPFEEIFKDSYGTAHRLDTNRLRNVSKFFAHLLFTDSISWEVLECVKLNEEDTTSSSRIYIKILFQELAEYMGLKKLHDRLNDPTLSYSFSGLFPRDNPKNTRFSINFFTSIGLGGLTDELREHLKNMPKNVPPTTIQVTQSSSSSSSSSSSDSSSDSSTDSSDSDEDDTRSSKKKDRSGKEKAGKSSKTQEMEGHGTEKDKDEQRWDHGGFYENYGQGARRYEPQNRDKYERRSGRDDRRYKDNNRQDRDKMEKGRKDRKERDGKYTDNGRDRGETERRRDDKKQRYERDNTYEYDKHKDDRRERDKTREDRHRDETESRRGDRDDYYDNYKDYELDRGETERRRDNRTDKLDKNDKGKKRYEDKRKDRTEKSKKNKYRDEEERSSDKRDKRSEKENKYDKQRESDDSDDEYYRDKDKSNKKDYRYDKERDGDMQDKHSQKRDKFDKRIEQEKEKDDKRQHKVASKVEVAPNAANDWERDSDTEKPELGRYWDVGVKAQ